MDRIAHGGAPPSARMPSPHVLFLGRLYAGHRTRFSNLRAHVDQDRRVRASYRSVSGWVPGGAIERITWMPRGLRGRARAAVEAAGVARLPRPDAIWTSTVSEITPYLWAQCGRLHRPLVMDIDWTLDQQEAWALEYFGRFPREGLRLGLARLQERAVWRGVTLFAAYSTWTADSLADGGVPAERICVLPPGVDLEKWRVDPRPRRRRNGPLRLLFVGGDFERKGGRLLVDLVRGRFAGRCELDVVTRDRVAPSAAVRIHRAEPNSAPLRELYARADLFVMPSRAECFGIATVEAMASCLPVIVGDVGGARDIVDQGTTGWRITPDAEGLASALEHALARREALPEMGRRGRAAAERHFDGRRNDTRLVDLLLEQIGRHRGS